MKIVLFSFFSGIGFFDLGFEDEGFKVSFVNEVHKPFLSAYKYARKRLGIDVPEFGYYDGSIIELIHGQQKRRLAELVSETHRKGSLVGFIGGPPCPDFSVGGKNKGREGANGRLSQTYAELICFLKPDFFLFENVKGLWRTIRHREFYDELKTTWNSKGYLLFEKMINAIEYCTPQDRERIILFGLYKKSLGHKISNPDGYRPILKFPWTKYAKYPNREAFHYPWATTSPFKEDSKLIPPNNIPLELTVEHWFCKNDVYNHPNSANYFKPRAGLNRFLAIDEGDDKKKSYKRLHRWRYSPTAAYGNNEVHLHPYKPRRLSVAEALAIQSLPKEFELPTDMSLTAMFKGIGNGVPFLVSKMIAKSIREFLYLTWA